MENQVVRIKKRGKNKNRKVLQDPLSMNDAGYQKNK